MNIRRQIMQKITISLLMLLLIFAASAGATDFMQAGGNQPQSVQNYDISKMKMYQGQTRNNTPVPDYNIVVNPYGIMTSYYDYMPGSYVSYPIRPQSDYGGGTYMTFFGTASTTTNRRQYWAYADAAGNVGANWATITTYDYWQGYGSMVVHPATGNPFAIWHEDFGTDPKLPFNYDDYHLLSIPGFWATPIVFYNTPPDQYCWPYIYLGDSPDGDNYKRVYQISNNAANNSAGYPCEDVRILYADIENSEWVDFSTIMNTANWEEVTVFTDWRAKSCRPFQSFAVDPNLEGHVAFIGCAVWLEGDLGDMPVEEGAFMWESFDYGETWDYANLYSDGPTDYFYTVANLPQFEDNAQQILPELEVGAIGYHSTATFDNYGLHFPYIQYYGYTDEGSTYYFNHYLPSAELVWNGTGFEYHNVPEFPWMDTGTSGHYVPWGVEGDDTLYVYSVAYSKYEPSGGAALFHESTQKQAVNVENNWMLQMWVDGTYVQLAEDGDPAYAAYAQHPIIYISVSSNNGLTWSEPLEFTDIYNPNFDFSNQITVYPYISQTIKDLGDDWGEIMYYYFNDNDFGSYVQGQGLQTGGEITQGVIQIEFPEVGIDDEPVQNIIFSQNYPNPFVASTKISFSSKKAFSEAAEVAIYNARGQLVRTLSLMLETPQTGFANWDGKDASNRNVTNGIYFYKLQGAVDSPAGKMLLTR